MKTWIESLGRLELSMTQEQAEACSHPGQCDADVEALRMVPEIASQLDAMNPAFVVEALQEYGAWEDEELKDHETNLHRILWLAAGDIADGNCDWED